ncbi:uncharacterized protein RHOBADRAFT_49210 [Rhodotorula graminis WP1]|uniref:non-specific serine/threonine protein kinase n=1 Tax=Rhodotorula graminis (strain WP1) TaxID=578459 RepID=A0A194SDH0_RHOGW|nr:uncharacterized protein RHOBADRAFT_49210 [Rhodotorula graminis WP1]KPV78642.1 hypothetical protein RHOBADRAFT_49210 [Rhodotorula graminis WP1]
MPPTALSGSTQHYRAYGKRKTNVINRRQPLGAWNASPVAAPAADGTTSSSDDSETTTDDSSSDDDDEPRVTLATRTEAAPCRRKPAKQPAFAVVVESRRSSSTRPPPGARTTASTSASKENGPAAVWTSSVSGKVQGKAVELVKGGATSGDEAARRSPLGGASSSSSSRRRPAQSGKKAVYGARRARATVVLSSGSSSEEEERLPTPPGVRRTPVVVQSSGSATSSPLTSLQATPQAVVVLSDEESEGEDELVDDRAALVLEDEASSLSVAESSDANDLVVVDSASSRAAPRSAGRFPPQLASLRSSLLSPNLFSFSSFVASPPAPFSATRPATAAPWRKIGEASYSEVFATTDDAGRDMVVKIIPVAAPSRSRTGTRGGSALRSDVPLPFVSSCDAVRREIEVSGVLGGREGGIDGFVRFRGAFLVQGSYPDELLSAWDDFKRAQGPACDEQVRPDVLPETQLFALLLLDNAGSALETFKLKSWVEAAGVLGQVVEALGKAEEECGFEHRDLHWGNILLQSVAARRAPASSLSHRLASLSLGQPSSPALSPLALLDPTSCGVRATLIDFTLSRCCVSTSADADQVVFDPFEDDDLFEGEGEYQFEVYRRMRALVERAQGEQGDKAWRASEPRTNVLWLHYLVDKLLHSSRLRLPPPPPPSPSSATPSSPHRQSGPAASPRRAPLAHRPVTRRTSTAFAPSLSSPARARARASVGGGVGRPAAFGSPLKPRARTLPTPTTASARAAAATEARERAAHDALVRAERALEAAVEGWGLGSGTGTGGRGAAKGRGRARKVVKVPAGRDAGLAFASAGEFARWWFGGF